MAGLCPRCGSEALAGARFCHRCGMHLNQGALGTTAAAPAAPSSEEKRACAAVGGEGERGEELPAAVLALRVQQFLLGKVAELLEKAAESEAVRLTAGFEREPFRALEALRREVLLVNLLDGDRALRKLEEIYETRYQNLRRSILGSKAWPLTRFFPSLAGRKGSMRKQ